MHKIPPFINIPSVSTASLPIFITGSSHFTQVLNIKLCSISLWSLAHISTRAVYVNTFSLNIKIKKQSAQEIHLPQKDTYISKIPSLLKVF